MNELSDLSRVLQLIEGVREKAFTGGQYNECIKEYEQILKFSQLLSNGTDGKLTENFQKLRTKLQVELKLLYELQKEMSVLGDSGVGQGGGIGGHGGYGEAGEERDPDVWPPPTPVVGGGRGGNVPSSSAANAAQRGGRNENVPSWARVRDNDVGN